ncbi:MAG: hypothetical protein QOI91_1867 [Solirubrobacteraceae bacterium]|nr:hypothetical protein [Solirubrobacteraceae bacterium]
MLGRRLLILAAVLLATGAMAAALTPRDRGRMTNAPTTSTATTPRATGGTVPGAAVAAFTIDSAARRPAVVRVRRGALLRLQVKSPSPDEVELVGLGRFEPVDRFSPARFEFFALRGGTFPIRLRGTGRVIGRLVVDAPPL